MLSDRSDIIVMTDEAHRSQYDTFALNMRNALPNAAFIGFTGTPLIAGEEKTREVFGDYVSIYNFQQSVDDGATVPLYYENRIPELQLTNDNLNDDMERLLEEAELDEAQEKKLEREFAREYHLITRDDRLETIAEDIVAHFIGRGFQGKAMVVCIDKATAVRMYDKVQKHWAAHLADAAGRAGDAATRSSAAGSRSADRLHAKRPTWRWSSRRAQNEIEDMAAKGLDIRPHRKRMVKEDLDDEVQGPGRPLPPRLRLRHVDDRLRRAVLLDDLPRQADAQPHPDADHRPRQPGLRRQGQRPDRGLRRRVPQPAEGAGDLRLGGRGRRREGELPVQAKARWWRALREAIAESEAFLPERGVDPSRSSAATGFEKVRLLDDAVERSSSTTRRSALPGA